jgi:hypothetical protein
VHRIDLAQCQAQEQREADHRAERGRSQRRQVAPLHAWCAGEPEVGHAEQAGEGGAPGCHEGGRQLRVGRSADGQPGHRQRHREDDDAEQAEPQASRFVPGVVPGGVARNAIHVRSLRP